MDSAILLALAIASAVLLVVTILARRRASDLETFEELQKHFFDAANRLVDDDRTPDEVIEMIPGLMRTIRERHHSRRILVGLVTGRVRAFHQNPPEKILRLRAAAEAMPNDLASWFHGMMIAYTLAITFRSDFAGGLVRRVMYQVAEAHERRDYGDRDTLDKVEPVLAPMACAA